MTEPIRIRIQLLEQSGYPAVAEAALLESNDPLLSCTAEGAIGLVTLSSIRFARKPNLRLSLEDLQHGLDSWRVNQ